MRVGPTRWSRPIIVGLLVGGACGAALLAELAVRYRERHRSDVPSSQPSAFYRHTRLRHALVRNLDYYGWFTVNSHGFRGPDFPILKPADEVRLMVVGGSTTFDTSAPADSLAWPSRLEHWLRVLQPDLRVRVINAGTAGYQVLDNLIRLQTELFAFEPDVILLYHGHNDVSCALADRAGHRTRQSNRPEEAPASTPWGWWLQHHSELYNKVLKQWRETLSRLAARRVVGRAPPPVDASAEPFLCGPRQFERDVSSFFAAAENLGIRVMTAPVVHISDPDATSEPDEALRSRWSWARPYAEPDSGLVLYQAYKRSLARLSALAGVPYIETAGFGLHGTEFYHPGDVMHFNRLGSEVMARELATAIQKRGLLAMPRADP